MVRVRGMNVRGIINGQAPGQEKSAREAHSRADRRGKSRVPAWQDARSRYCPIVYFKPTQNARGAPAERNCSSVTLPASNVRPGPLKKFSPSTPRVS